jgi:hypothetical protein
MQQVLDSNRVKPVDLRATIVLFCVCVAALIVFAMFGQTSETGNQDMGMRPGEQGLRLGVEEATSHPQLILPR